ncbi:class I SAM-dependent methyltransferase [Fulvivirga ligni]|uniref:class I SAM-dependent methyltransferase n=1 Tax=Fulvivirga ligni TaxID=2904246 RepID=UPI001F3196C5|nr:class I SAM-dependent methyltransferase [Fulvivirga ligni]UII21392.1 class I SAM-dependent methyltransferase [Fulvivirga ligni]
MATVATQNKRGFTYNLPDIGQQFIDEAVLDQGPVLDVGAAYGVATLPALEKGLQVVALDINKEHLRYLKANTPQPHAHRLETVESNFPYIDFPHNYFQSIYISQVFPFLKPFEIVSAAKKLHAWLKPGGKLYVVSFTPYLRHCESYLEIYHLKKEKDEPWAGYIECLPEFSKNNPVAAELPESINHVDEDDLRRVFSPFFSIEQLYLFGDARNELPEWIKYDDRERVGMVAKKLDL